MTKKKKVNKTNIFAKGSIRIILLLVFVLLFVPIPTFAVDTVPTEEFVNLWEERKSLPVETNLIEEWPQGPEIGAESAIVMETDTGTILYAKNINEKLFPASITKMMTALLVVENTTMDEVVTFSNEAIDNTEWGSSRIGIMKGEQLTVEQCLYGLLLGSANEVAYGLAEHVGGNLETFVQMMNEKATELGCVNTHFANASGLPDPNHYVSAYDMTKIAQEFFNNDTLCLISGKYSYTIPATNKTDETRPLENHHKMIIGKKYEYEGIIGGKTGFTSEARQTLVTCAQRDGMKLICVIMKDEAPNQFTDTIELFDYGFTCFQKLPIADHETRYNLSGSNFFHTNLDIMGSSKSILSLNKEGYVVIPKVMDFENVEVRVNYDIKKENAVAALEYYVGNNKVGSTSIDYSDAEKKTFEFANIITDNSKGAPEVYKPEQKTVFVTVSKVIKILLIGVGIVFAIIVIIALIIGFIKSAKRAKMKNRKRYKQRSENSRRYNYKKRSENKQRHNPNEPKPNRSYTAPVYKELQKRSARAAMDDNSDSSYRDDNFYEENGYFDEEEAYEEEMYSEEQMYDDFPELRGYGVELHSLDNPNRWE